MIERQLCSYLICDECPDDDPEVGPYGQDESDALAFAKGEGWRVDGNEHICWRCLEAKRHEECAADGGHDFKLAGFGPGGVQVHECRTCHYWHQDEQPALIDAAPKGATA